MKSIFTNTSKKLFLEPRVAEKCKEGQIYGGTQSVSSLMIVVIFKIQLVLKICKKNLTTQRGVYNFTSPPTPNFRPLL